MYIYLTEEGLKITESALNTYEKLIKKVDFSNIRKLSQIDEDED